MVLVVKLVVVTRGSLYFALLSLSPSWLYVAFSLFPSETVLHLRLQLGYGKPRGKSTPPRVVGKKERYLNSQILELISTGLLSLFFIIGANVLYLLAGFEQTLL